MSAKRDRPVVSEAVGDLAGGSIYNDSPTAPPRGAKVDPLDIIRDEVRESLNRAAIAVARAELEVDNLSMGALETVWRRSRELADDVHAALDFEAVRRG